MSWKDNKKSRQQRGYGAAYGRARSFAMARDFYLCQPCARAGRVTPATECDHVVPKHKGGDDSPDNLQAICVACHKQKTGLEAATAQGRRPRISFGDDGWPI